MADSGFSYETLVASLSAIGSASGAFISLSVTGKEDKIVPFYMGENIFNMANNPKFKYFTDIDDHMMDFDEKLINEIDLFINSLN